MNSLFNQRILYAEVNGAYDTIYSIKRIVPFQINCSFVPMLTMFQRLAVSKTFVTDWTL